MATGLYREKNGWVTEDSAKVRYPGGHEMDKPRSRYEADGDTPAFDTLPTKDEYEGRNA